jgi:hypothetical protein
MREQLFTLSRTQGEEMWRRFKQTDDLALPLSYTNATFAEDRLSEQRIGRLRRLVDADDHGLDTPLRSVERGGPAAGVCLAAAVVGGALACAAP